MPMSAHCRRLLDVARREAGARPETYGMQLVVTLGLLAGLVACGVQAHPTAPTHSPGDPGGSSDPGNSGEPSPDGTGGSNGPSVSGTGGAGAVPSGSGGQPGVVGTGGSGASPGGAGGQTGATGSGGARPGGTGGAAVSGPGVTINGTFVPKEKAVAILHFGHSNMRGYARSPSSLNSYFFNTQDGLWSYKGSFMLAKEPTAPEANQTGSAGPGMALLRAAQATATAGSGVQFISIGYGKGSATTVDYAKSGTYYPAFMNWATQLKGKVTFGAIVIMLGITERHLPTSQIPGFPMRVAQIVSDIRADLGEPNLPVLFCDYEMGATRDLAPTGAVGQQMIPLIKMLPTVVQKLVLVPTDGLGMQDDHHFNLQGHKDWADRAIMLMKTNGWFPW